MSDIRAGVIAVTNFITSTSKKFQGMIDYMDREEAVRCKNLDKYNSFSGYLDYMDNEKKTIYMETENINSMSKMFTKHKNSISLDEKNELKKIFKLAQERGSLMWQTVISFDNRFLKELGIYDKNNNLVDEEKLITASRKAISDMLLAEKLENTIWAGNIHFNTDNIHIHISTVEPVPTRKKEWFYKYKTKNGKYVYNENKETGEKDRIPLLDEKGNHIRVLEYRGVFKQSSLDKLKSSILSEINSENTKEINISINNMMRDIIKNKREIKLMKIDEMQKDMMSLYSSLKAKESTSTLKRNNWRYNQNQIAFLKEDIDKITNYYIENYMKEDFDKINKLLDKQEAFYLKAYGQGSRAFEYKDAKIKDFYTRMGNTVLKELANYDEEVSKNEYIKTFQKNSQNSNELSNDLYLKKDINTMMFNLRKSMRKEKEKYLNELDYLEMMKDIEMEI